MKKILLPILMLLAVVGTSKAQTNALSVADIDLPKNYEASLIVSFQLDAADTYTGYSFNLELPSDLEFVMDEGTNVAFTKGGCHADNHGVTANLDEGLVKVAALSLSSKPLTGTSGTLLTFTIKPKSALTVGQTFTGTIKDILIVPVEGEKKSLANSTFTITIGEDADLRTILDENSTTAPEAATGVDVRVKRTITANHWSTICLPFDMTGAQVKSAFGDDVVLCDFKGYDPDSDVTLDGENVVGIEIHFENINISDGLSANRPYIIKVSSTINEFTADGVNLNPVEDEAYIEYDNGKSGSRRQVYSGFYGTYKAGVILQKNSLFLNDNKFYYSKGNTGIKAFRAYFDVLDVLTDVENAAARVKMSITDGNGNTTNIDPRTMTTMESGKVYNMNGQYVGEVEDANSLPKGIYIVNGKKKVIK